MDISKNWHLSSRKNAIIGYNTYRNSHLSGLRWRTLNGLTNPKRRGSLAKYAAPATTAAALPARDRGAAATILSTGTMARERRALFLAPLAPWREKFGLIQVWRVRPLWQAEQGKHAAQPELVRILHGMHVRSS